MNLQQNMEAYSDLWIFVNERHKIYLKKTAGEPKPWTKNKILRDWRFCNVFRKLDKQSQLLQQKVIIPMGDTNLPLLLFNIFAFRAFNWWETFDQIRTHGSTYITEWDTEDIIRRLRVYYLSTDYYPKQKLISGAYMIRGYKGKPKYESIPETLGEIWEKKEELAESIFESWYMLDAFNEIMARKFWGWGPFTIYQVILDMLYTPLLQGAADVNSWCIFGPGAQRGLREIWPDLPLKQEWMLAAAQSLLADQVKYRDAHVPEMNLQDIEFCLCESFKYRRIKKGGRGKETYAGK